MCETSAVLIDEEGAARKAAAAEMERRKRVELLAEIVKNEQNVEQCNEETGRYNREFLYNIRDLDRLCSVTECPLELHQLKEFGIYRGSKSRNYEKRLLLYSGVPREPRSAQQEEEKQMSRDELLAEIAKNEQNLEQCNEETGRYNREFLYSIRDLERLCSITACPLEPHQLKEFGICPSQVDSKLCIIHFKNPFWKPPGGKRGTTTRLPKRADPVRDEPVEPIQELAQQKAERRARAREAREANEPEPDTNVELHKADRPWKLEKIYDDSDEAKNTLLIRQVRAILNKISPEVDKSLAKEFVDCKVYQSPVLSQVVSMLVEVPLEEPKYSKFFAKLCRSQIAEELGAPSLRSSFREAIISRLDEVFHQVFSEWKESVCNEKKVVDSPEELFKLKSRRFGFVMFISQLYLRSIVDFGPVSSFFRYLFNSLHLSSLHPEEALLECAIGSLGVVGKRLAKDSVRSAKKPAEGSAAESDEPFPFDWAFSILEKLKLRVSSRIRFMILDLEEQRANGWKARENTREFPSAIDPIAIGHLLRRKAWKEGKTIVFKENPKLKRQKNSVNEEPADWRDAPRVSVPAKKPAKKSTVLASVPVQSRPTKKTTVPATVSLQLRPAKKGTVATAALKVRV